MIDWKSDIKSIHDAGCSDSDIAEYINLHFTELNAKEVWNYVYELDAPSECKGCKYIQMTGMHPCMNCSRRVKLDDYYEAR